MKRMKLAGAVLVAAMAIGCAGDTTAPNILAGMVQVTVADSTGTAPPQEPMAPGFFRGVVMGYESGPDTLANAQRLAGVSVKAYARVGDQPSGDAVAAVTSDANGEWQLPTLPGGEYVVTFTPAGNTYHGAWTIGRTSASSGEHKWWIMLAAQ